MDKLPEWMNERNNRELASKLNVSGFEGIPRQLRRLDLQLSILGMSMPRDISIRTFPPYLSNVLLYLNSQFPEYRHFLDLGCGDGFPLASVSRLGYFACGIERDKGTAETCRENLSSIGINDCPVIEGDYTCRDIWEREVHSRRLSEYDIFYVWNYTEHAISAIASASRVMQKDRLIVLPMFPEQSFAVQFGEPEAEKLGLDVICSSPIVLAKI